MILKLKKSLSGWVKEIQKISTNCPIKEVNDLNTFVGDPGNKEVR